MTGGILRHFRAFSTPEQNPALEVLSRPAHPQVTQTVSRLKHKQLRMKNIIVKIIGLIALSVGAYNLYSILTNILDSVTSSNFLAQISKLTIAWVAVYGGYQAIKAGELGRKLLVAWLSYQILGLAAVAWIILYNFKLHPENNFSSLFPNQYLSIGFYVFCISALIFLATIKLNEDLHNSDSHRIKIVGKLLSVLSPGLGRVIVGNYWLGIGLSMFYMILVIGRLTANGSDVTNPIVNFIYSFIVWSIFSQIDWHSVGNYGKSELEKLAPDPKTDSVQAHGG